MQWDGDPWTDRQITLAVVAVLLAFCCVITFTLNEIHNHIIAQAPASGAATFSSPKS